MYSNWALHPEQQHHHSLNRLQYGSTIPHFYLPLSRFRLQFGFFCCFTLSVSFWSLYFSLISNILSCFVLTSRKKILFICLFISNFPGFIWSYCKFRYRSEEKESTKAWTTRHSSVVPFEKRMPFVSSFRLMRMNTNYFFVLFSFSVCNLEIVNYIFEMIFFFFDAFTRNLEHEVRCWLLLRVPTNVILFYAFDNKILNADG